MAAVLLALVLLGGGAGVGALLVLRHSWDLDSPVDVLREICTGLLPHRAPDGGRVQRRVVRRLGGECLVTPAGSRAAYAHLTVWLHPRDHLALAQVMPLPDLEREFADTYLTHGHRRGWRLPVIAPRVSIRPNLRVSAGAVRIDATPGALQPGPRQAYTAEARTTPDGDATAPSLHLQAQGPYPSVVLAPDEVADAGRSRECRVRIDDGAVSRRHVRLEIHQGSWYVADLQSRNGTWIGGRRIDRAPLDDGDVLALGRRGPRWTVHLVTGRSIAGLVIPVIWAVTIGQEICPSGRPSGAG